MNMENLDSNNQREQIEFLPTARYNLTLVFLAIL